MLKVESHLIISTSYYKQELRLLQLKDKESCSPQIKFEKIPWL